MGSWRHGGGRTRRARRLVPAAAVAATVAGVAGVLATRRARRPAQPVGERPELPARRTAPSGPRRLATRTPPQPTIDLDVATRALSALATEPEPTAPDLVEPEPAERGPAEHDEPGPTSPEPTEATALRPAEPATATATVRPWGRRRRRVRLAGAVAVVALGVGAGAALAEGGADDDADPPPGPASTSSERGTTTTLASIDATTAFPRAAEALVAAGSFTYAGTVSATDVSHARPMLWLGVDSTVTGEVSLDLGRVHELAVADDQRVSETVTSGPTVWGRRVADGADLATAVYEAVPELSAPEGGPAVRGAALLPVWLAAASSPSDLGTDQLGRRTFTAIVPAAVLGPVERGTDAVDGQLTLSVDPAGRPARLVLVAVGGPAFRLAIDITGTGGPVDIQLPGAPPA